MNSATGLEVPPPSPSLAALSLTAQSLAGMSILGQAVLAVGDPVPMVVGGVQTRPVVVTVQAPLVDAIGCWLRTWMKKPQKILSQRLLLNHPHLLYSRLSINNYGSLRKRRSRGCMKVPWPALNRSKVSSRSLPLNRARHFTRFVRFSDFWRHH